MFRSIILSVALMFSTVAFANEAVPNPCQNIPEVTKGKTTTEIAAILESCRSNSGSTILPSVNPEDAVEWSDAAKGFAEALGMAARELGIATNDFLNSPAGVLLAGILLINYAGGAIIGLPFSLFSILLVYSLFRRFTAGEVKYELAPVLWGAFHIRRKVQVGDAKDIDGNNSLSLFVYIIALGALNLMVWVNVS